MNGDFAIRDVKPGSYYAQARLQGYLSQSDMVFGSIDHASPTYDKALNAAFPVVSVTAAQTAVLNLSLTRAARLGGTVAYDDGSPAIGVWVRLYRQNAKGEWKHYTNEGFGMDSELPSMTTRTDEHGHFYKPSLVSGTYTVEASLPEITLVPDALLGPAGLNVSYTDQDALRVYTGDKFTLYEASAVEIKDGEDRNDLAICIPTSDLHTLQGVVVAQATNAPVTYGTVRLLASQDKQLLRESPIQPDGSFIIHYVPSGSYIAEVDANADMKQERHGNSYAMMDSALLVESDISDLNYAVSLSTRN